MLNAEELEKLKGMKIQDAVEERTDMHYVYLQLSHGKKAILSSRDTIYLEVEAEQ